MPSPGPRRSKDWPTSPSYRDGALPCGRRCPRWFPHRRARLTCENIYRSHGGELYRAAPQTVWAVGCPGVIVEINTLKIGVAAYGSSMRVLVVEDEQFLAEAVRDGLRMEAIAADVALDGHAAFEMLDLNAYDVVVLDRDVPGTRGDDIAALLTEQESGPRVIMVTAASTISDKQTGFRSGADGYLTKPFAMEELVLRLRALHRRRPAEHPPVLEEAGVRLDPFRREVYRDGRYISLTRKQFAVLHVLMTDRGGVISAEHLLERAWDENADPFTNAVRITISSLRKRLGDPAVIHTVPGVGYRFGDNRPSESP